MMLISSLFPFLPLLLPPPPPPSPSFSLLLPQSAELNIFINDLDKCIGDILTKSERIGN